MDLEQHDKQRKHIVVLSAYRFWPVQDGGHQRNWNLYVELEEKFDVTVVAIDWSGESKFSETEAGSQLIAISPPNEVIVTARLLAPQVGFHSWDMLGTLLCQKFDHLEGILSRLNEDTDLVILSRPWLAPLIVNFPNKPLILDLHDIESVFTTGESKVIQEFDTNLQKLAISNADAVTLCTQRDLDSLSVESVEKYFVIPNGFQELKSGTSKSIIKCGIVFVGSGHKPNVDACKRIYKIAKQLPAYHFLVIGSVSRHLDLLNPPSNVQLLGFLQDQELHSILESALCFINPMDGGSGSSLKIAQALSFGLPIISTEFGMRGFETLSRDAWLHAEDDVEFARGIEELSLDRIAWQRISKVSQRESSLYDWKNIRKDFVHIVDNLLIKYKGENIGPQGNMELQIFNQELKELGEEAVRSLNKDIKTILRQRYEGLPTWLKTIIRKTKDIRIVKWGIRKTFLIFLSFLKVIYSWDVKTAINRVNVSYRAIHDKQS
jgi:glycosyltransferase involved in cell wall biosynthesis